MIVSAREFLSLSLDHFDGAGVRLLIVDAATVDSGFARSVQIVSEANHASSDVSDGVPCRRLSLLVDEGKRNGAPGGSLGVVRNAEVVHLSVPEMRCGLDSVLRCVEEHGPFHVIGLCEPFDREPSSQLLAQLGKLAEGALVVATATLTDLDLGPDVLAVRTTAPSQEQGGPFVQLSEAVAISARAPDGSLGHLELAQAVVPLVVGWAAVWCGRLRAANALVSPSILRALALAGLGGTSNRIPCDLADLPCILQVRLDGQPISFQVRANSPRNPVAMAAAVESLPRSPMWFSPSVLLAFQLEGDAAQSCMPHGDGWACLETRSIDTTVNGTLKHGGFNGEVVVVAFGAQVHAHKEAAARRTSIKKPLTIVGISASHDASACVLRDGKLVRAIQLERLTRVKHDGQVFLHSSLAVDYCLSSLGLRERDVDFFAFNCMPLSPGVTGLGLPSHDDGFRLFDPFGDRAVFVSHHLSHALGAFHGSPFETATVIVADGSGGTTVGKPDLLLSGPELLDYLSTPSHHLEPLHVQSVYRFGGNGWTLVDREYSDVFNPISGVSRLGEAYATISGYVFGDWQASGKVMGLAPYGDPERFGGTLLIRDEHGRLQFGNHWRNQHRRVLKRGAPMEYRDLAARVQRDLETALIDRFRSAIAKTKCGDVAYAGGIALNSVANQRLRTETGATGLYVMPSCHDAGISIGAAVGAHKFATGELSPNSIATDAFGHPYSRRDIAAAIAQSDGLVQKQVVGLEDIVDLLAARKIVGWFDGGSEFGPRSLGQRSLLAAPTDRDMWTYINRRIKFREDFRPFAPMVPEEVASEYFEIDEPSPFMLRVVRVRDRYRQMLGAITHVDGTARVQTVRRDVLPKLHELLHRVGARLGVPVLVNTSFNVRGEPLVETPGQAIEMLMATHLDAVVFNGDTLVQPYSMPTKALTPELVLQLPPKCRLDVRITHSERRYLLVPEARGSDAAVELPEWAYQLISQLDGERSVSTFIDALSADLRPAAHRLLESLVALRLLAIKGGVPQGSANGLSTLPLPPAIHPLTGTAVDDPTPLVAGTQRTEYLAQTISRVKSKLAVMQVGRVADVSDYDHLRIPVISCIRPFVSEEDITCTQGKGVDLDHALASALMETVERYSAWHHRHLRTRIATPAELSRSSEPFLPISRLGGRDVETGAFEWVWAQGLNGTRPRWVPAAAVFSPYEPPSGVTAPLSWCTTGLSAGNTLHEAIAHGLLEVVERNALSRYQVGHPGRLLDVSSLPEGPERDLFARFSQAGIEFFVVAFDEISALPAFSVSLYEPEGPEPRIPVSGQGCNPSPRIALQRAALEAAQSRVVAIQGSREDLVRHGSDWIADQAARSAHWQRAREAASRNGTVQLPKEPISPRTVGELIAQVVTPLRLQGFEEVLYVDLTNPRVGIPVACVIIPGMYDIDTIPESRSSNYREFA